MSKKFVISMSDPELGKKSITIPNPKDGITVQQVNAFLNAYDPVFEADYTLLEAKYQTTTDDVVYPAA